MDLPLGVDKDAAEEHCHAAHGEEGCRYQLDIYIFHNFKKKTNKTLIIDLDY